MNVLNEQLLQPSERVDDLLTHELRIIQSDEVFSFSMDAVLLARFASIPKRGRVLDLCTGNGVVPLLLSTRTEAQIDGVEIQSRLHDMASRSVEMNGLQERIRIVQGDLKTYYQEVGYEVYDAITVNPPYMKMLTGEHKLNVHQAMARHELGCTLEDVIVACKRLIRTGGKVSMVHRPSRLGEIVSMMREHKLEPKRIRFVHSRVDQEANMVLVEAIRDGKPDLRLLPPLIVYNENNEYCEELLQIYYGPKVGRDT